MEKTFAAPCVFPSGNVTRIKKYHTAPSDVHAPEPHADGGGAGQSKRLLFMILSAWPAGRLCHTKLSSAPNSGTNAVDALAASCS